MERLTFLHFMEIKHLCGIVWLVNCIDFSPLYKNFVGKLRYSNIFILLFAWCSTRIATLYERFNLQKYP